MAMSLKKTLKAVVDKSKDGTDAVAAAIPGDVKDLAGSLGTDKPIVGKFGKDVINGTKKSDVILADPTVKDDVGGDDEVDGRKGDDTIYTFGGDDTVWGGKGDDIILTADGDDWVDAGPGNDDVQSGRGQDEVYGGLGKDELRGGEGNDRLDGGEGNDRIIGGSDDDTLIDGPGADIMEGRTGDDTIILVDDGTTDSVLILAEDVGDGVDTIRGFSTAAPEVGGDLIDLSQIGDTAFLAAAYGDDVLLFAEPGSEAAPILIALVESVTLDELLDDNIATPEDVVVAPTTLEALGLEATDVAELPAAPMALDALVPVDQPAIL